MNFDANDVDEDVKEKELLLDVNIAAAVAGLESEESSTRVKGSGSNDVNEIHRQKEIKKMKDLIALLQGKLERRNTLMEDLVKAYHRDVITTKTELEAYQAMNTKQRTQYRVSSETKDNVPSIDMKQYLEMHNPAECFMKVTPCETCGGHLDVLHEESQKIKALRAQTEELEEKMKETSTLLEQYRDEAARDKELLAEEKAKVIVDRQLFEKRVLEMKAEVAKFDPNDIEELRSENIALRNKVKEQNKVIENVEQMEDKINQMEVTVKEAEGALLAKEREVRELNKENASNSETLQNLGKKVKIMEAEKDEQALTINALEKDKKKLTKKVEDITVQMKKLQVGYQKEKQEAAVTNAKFNKANNSLNTVNKENQTLKRESQQLKAKLKETERALSESSKALENKPSSTEQVKSSDSLIVNVTESQRQSEEVKKENQELKLKLKEMEKALSKSHKESKTAQPVSEQVISSGSPNVNITEIEIENQTLKEENERLKAKVKEMEKDLMELAEEKKSVPEDNENIEVIDNINDISQNQQLEEVESGKTLINQQEEEANEAVNDVGLTTYDEFVEEDKVSITEEEEKEKEINLTDDFIGDEDLPISEIEFPGNLDENLFEQEIDLNDLDYENGNNFFDDTAKEDLTRELEETARKLEDTTIELEITRKQLADEINIRKSMAESLAQLVSEDENVEHVEDKDKEEVEKLEKTSDPKLDSLNEKETSSEEKVKSLDANRLEVMKGRFIEGIQKALKRKSMDNGIAIQKEDANSELQKALEEIDALSAEVLRLTRERDSMKERLDKYEGENRRLAHRLSETKAELDFTNEALVNSENISRNDGDSSEGLQPNEKEEEKAEEESEVQNKSKEDNTGTKGDVGKERRRSSVFERTMEDLKETKQELLKVKVEYEEYKLKQVDNLTKVKQLQEQLETLKEEKANLEEELVDQNFQWEERKQEVEDELNDTKMSLGEEKETTKRLNENLESITKTSKDLQEQIVEKDDMIDGLREAIKEKLQEISDAHVEKNEAIIAINFDLEKEKEKLSRANEEIKTITASKDNITLILAKTIASGARTSKALEESLEKRLKASELKAAERFVRDPGVKALVRRWDKRDPLEGDTVLGFLKSAKNISFPAEYMCCRLDWAQNNAYDYLVNTRLKKKEGEKVIDGLEKDIKNYNKVITKLENKIADREEELATTIAMKKKEIDALKQCIEDGEKREQALKEDILQYEGIKDKCNQLLEENELAVIDRDKAFAERDAAVVSESIYRTKNEELVSRVVELEKIEKEAGAEINILSTDLKATKDALATSEERLRIALETIRLEELRRSSSTCVGTQFNPETEDASCGTEFVVPDMNLSHSLAIENSGRSNVGDLYIERVVTVNVAKQLNRRIATTMQDGKVLRSGNANVLHPVPEWSITAKIANNNQAPPDIPVPCSLPELVTIPERLDEGTGNKSTALTGIESNHYQPIGSLRGELQAFLAPHKDAAVFGSTSSYKQGQEWKQEQEKFLRTVKGRPHTLNIDGRNRAPSPNESGDKGKLAAPGHLLPLFGK